MEICTMFKAGTKDFSIYKIGLLWYHSNLELKLIEVEVKVSWISLATLV